MNRCTLMAAGALLCPATANAFCGAYVGAEGDSIHNNASRIVIAREAPVTTITMFNDFEANTTEFGMIIPVSATIDADNVRLTSTALLDRIDRYSAPRLVQYTCEDFYNDNGINIDPGVISPTRNSSAASARSISIPDVEGDTGMDSVDVNVSVGCSGGGSSHDYLTETDTSDDWYDTGTGVTVEDSFTLGEYELWVLRSADTNGLASWLTDNGFILQDGTEEMLDEYVSTDARFLALRINTSLIPTGRDWLTPLQLAYVSDAWSLPIRLGTASSSGMQDLIVYTLTTPDEGRVAVSNYPETVPPVDECTLGISPYDPITDFSNQYETLWSAAAGVSDDRPGLAWTTEYSWGIDRRLDDTTMLKCDPCPEPDPRDPSDDPITAGELKELGLASADWGWHVTRLRLRYTPDAVPQDLMLYGSKMQDRSQVRYIVHRWELEDLLPSCGGAPAEPGSCYSSEYWARVANGNLEPVIATVDPGRMACKGSGRSLLLLPLAFLALGTRRTRGVQ